jgi:DnaJ like chaperone protein
MVIVDRGSFIIVSIWQKISNIFSSNLFSVISEKSKQSPIVKTIGQALDLESWLFGGRDAAFTLSLVALSAKMAGADGVVTNSEIAAFRASVEIPSGSEKQVERIFELAQSDVAGFQTYAKKIRRLFIDEPQTLEYVLESLFSIAAADGLIHEAELEYLKSVSEIFGFDDARFEQIAAAFLLDDNGVDPFIVLGLTPKASNEEIKRVYRSLVTEHHPDRLISKGVPKEMLDMANTRMAAINVAYNEISKARAI